MRSHRRLFLLGSTALLVFAAQVACNSKAEHPHGTPDAGNLGPDEPGEDPNEERAETPVEERAEEIAEPNGKGGAPAQATPTASAGAAAAAGGGVATAPPNGGSAGGGGALATGGSSNDTSAGPVKDGGGVRGGNAGAGDGGAQPPSFPTLTASQLGRPTRITTAVSLTLAEGPLWDPCAHRLLFVDVTASKIYSLTSDDQIALFASNTGNANGIAFAPDGALILAQMARPGHVSRRAKDGTITPLEPAGSRLHTPDDVIVRSDGVIYFTDGDFPPVGGFDTAPLPVYALLPGASQLLNGGSVPGPNGIELSPDEKILYVDAYYQGSVIKYSVMPDGSIKEGASLATGLRNPDSLCLDAAGNLYVAVSSGLQVLRPDGSAVGLIPVPVTTGVTNCTFGGDDGTTLYITAWTTIWKIPMMPIPGLEWSVNRKRLQCQ